MTRIARVGVLLQRGADRLDRAAIELLDTPACSRCSCRPARRRSPIASHLNHIVTPSFIFFGISVALFGVVRATGAVMAPLVILTISLLVVRFPLAELLLDRYQVDAVWWSFPVSSALSALLAVLYYRYGGWRRAHMMRPARAAEPRALHLRRIRPAIRGANKIQASTPQARIVQGGTACRHAPSAPTAPRFPLSDSAAWA